MDAREEKVVRKKKRYSIWNDGKTYYKVDKDKKKVEIYRANDPERDKYSGMFNFDADNFVYSVKAVGNTFCRVAGRQ